jgi:hypothetical protein
MFQRSGEVERGLNLKQKMIVVIADVLLLAELTYSIYIGSRDPEYMTNIFLRTFIPMVVGTLVLTRLFLRKYESR